jgi:hypothetical protein
MDPSRHRFSAGDDLRHDGSQAGQGLAFAEPQADEHLMMFL